MLVPTRDVRVVVITERWCKAYRREDGTEFPEGYLKPKGWPARASQHPDGGFDFFKQWDRRAYHVCSLYQALTHHASAPAYFVGYKPTLVGLRLRKDCLNPLFRKFIEDAGGVVMHLALLDVDNHDEGADIEEWWGNELEHKIAPLLDAHPGLIVYRSKRGYRLIAILPDPIPLKDGSDSAKWDRMYTAWCNYLNRRFNIKADVLLDWTRFQAVPHTKKEKDEPALDLEIIGNVEEIGYWIPELTAEDWPPEKQIGTYDGVNFEGDCQLLQLLQSSGLRCEATEYANVYDICCPNWTSHSADSRGLQDYPTKTVLYTNGPMGKIECKSSGCQRSHPDRSKDYLRHFPAIDVEATRPKPPIDVWDHDVLALSNYRNALCDNVSVDAYLQTTVLSDDTYLTYQSALKNQSRLKRKLNDSGTGS